MALYAVEFNYDRNKPAESRFSDFKVVLSNVDDFVGNSGTWQDLENISFQGESEGDTKLEYIRFKAVTFRQFQYFSYSKKNLSSFRDLTSEDPFVKV